MSKCIIIVGNTGTGKTTEARRLMRAVGSMEKYIYDVNNEYKDIRGAVFCEFKEFLAEAKHKENTCILFEEATIFFSHSNSTETIKNILVRKRHTNNLLIFNFHALRQVPLFILDFANYIIIGKTNDLESRVSAKFADAPKIYTAWQDAQEDEDRYVKIHVKLN